MCFTVVSTVAIVWGQRSGGGGFLSTFSYFDVACRASGACFGERTPCAFPLQRTCAVPGIICLLRSAPLKALQKQVCKLLSAFSSACGAQLCNSLEILLS